MAVKKKLLVGGMSVALLIGAALPIAVPSVKKHEGVWYTAKIDQIGTGKPVTWCYGETEGPVAVGTRFTPQQCDAMLSKKLVRYANSAVSCIYVPISAKMLASYIDFNYNVGEAAFCKSTVVRKLNQLDYEGACEAMRPWVNSGGQFRQGLLNRRIDEIALCRDGIPAAKAGRIE
jgi:lysozyme